MHTQLCLLMGMASMAYGMDNYYKYPRQDNDFMSSYEAFRDADPSDPELIKSLYYASSSLSRQWDESNSLAILLKEPPPEPDRPTIVVADYDELDLQECMDKVPTDSEFDAMPNMTWSAYLWSWVPGTSSWTTASAMAAAGQIINYRPISRLNLIGPDTVQAKIKDTASLLQTMNENIQKMMEDEKITEMKHFAISSLSSHISGIPLAIDQFREYILSNGDKIRKYDHLTHTFTNVYALTGLLAKMNQDIDESAESQKILFERLTMPMMDLLNNETQLTDYKKYVYEMRAAVPALQAVNDALHDLLLRQMKLLNELVKHLCDKLVSIAEQSQSISRAELFGLYTAATTLPGDSVKKRICAVVSRLEEDDLIYLHSLVPRDELPFLMEAIIQRAAVVANVPLKRIVKLSRKKSLEWALMMADSNLIDSSSDDEDAELITKGLQYFNFS